MPFLLVSFGGFHLHCKMIGQYSGCSLLLVSSRPPRRNTIIHRNDMCVEREEKTLS